MIFCGRTDHRRTADIDVLDAIFIRRALRNRRLERIEVDDQKIDRKDAVIARGFFVFGVAANTEKTAMHARMQCLHPAVHHLRKAGQFRNVDDVQSRRFQS